ncbi:AraC family transcriptional regulator [Roseibium aggregatum]|uniref:Helix-turn-helix domain-containing protein n=1 Tax=Roseibium aggregatum TaxID=187304 RepID=A0A926NVA3_9HYPH|nr:AraC family transcriptional regulator [Roseibium aggregatum]MBD1547069.1 helix-turn-helix domain-containing protein [Roseibium aggregatum]
MFQPTDKAWIQGSPVARLGVLAKARGLDWEAILRSYDIDAARIEDPDATVGMATALDLFNHVAEVIGDDACILDHFYETPVGFTQGYDYVGLCASTVREGLSNWAKVTLLRSNCAKTIYSEDAETAKLEWTIPGLYHDFRQFSLAFLGWAIRRAEMLLDDAYWNLTIHVSSPRPVSSSRVLQKYGHRVKFNQSDHGVIVPAGLLDRRPPTADPVLLQIIEQHVYSIIKEHSAEISPLSRIVDAMDTLLTSGDCSAEAVARELGMSRRSLQRTLGDHGTTYRNLLAEVRRSLAEKYLVNTELPMKEIAYLLGFSEISAFSRAVKSWYGVPPRSVRQRVHALPSARVSLLRHH